MSDRKPEITDRVSMPYPKGYYGTPSPRCYMCGGIVYRSNCVCSRCGQVNILPEEEQV